jgi:conjugative transfer signal peptidase TraF
VSKLRRLVRIFVLGDVIALLAAGASGVLLRANHAVFNHSDSMPIGYYLRAPLGFPERGSIVLACVPPAQAELARRRGYLGPGDCEGLEEVVKIVAAVAGDRVTVNDRGVSVDGRRLVHSERDATDRLNRPMPRLAAGVYEVPTGFVWLEAPTLGSWDSRYYGPIPVTLLRSRAIPLLPWKWPNSLT